jgi:hypothetical protein
MHILTEYENKKIFNVEGIVKIYGKWVKTYSFYKEYYYYDCKVKYSEPLFYFQFYEFKDEIEWSKNQRIWTTGNKDYRDMTYIGINVKKDYVMKNGVPKVYKGKMELGKLFLFAEYDGIKQYLLFLNGDIVKKDRKRDYVWRIKNQYINETNENLANKIRVHKKGIIDLF